MLILGVFMIIVMVPILVVDSVDSAADIFDSDDDENCTFPTDEIVLADAAFIGLIFSACPSQQEFDAFIAAAAKWNSIITAKPLPTVTLPNTFLSAEQICGSNFMETDFALRHLQLLFMQGLIFTSFAFVLRKLAAISQPKFFLFETTLLVLSLVKNRGRFICCPIEFKDES